MRTGWNYCANTLAVCQRIGTGEKGKRLAGTQSLWTKDAELLHAKLERRALEAQSRGRAIWTCENPVGLLQNSQDVPALHFLKG